MSTRSDGKRRSYPIQSQPGKHKPNRNPADSRLNSIGTPSCRASQTEDGPVSFAKASAGAAPVARARARVGTIR